MGVRHHPRAILGTLGLLLLGAVLIQNIDISSWGGSDVVTGESCDPRRFRTPPGLECRGGDLALDDPTDVPVRTISDRGRPASPSGVSVRLTVRPPADGLYALDLQRWVARAGAWACGHPEGSNAERLTEQTKRGGTTRLVGLAVGKYRIIEVYADAVVGHFDVLTDGTAPSVEVDLSRFGYATGRVLRPDGSAAAGTLLRVVGPSREAFGWGVGERSGVAADGTFQLRVRGDRPTSVDVIHPLLRPPGGSNPIRLPGPREGIVIRLERGPVATIRPTSPILPTGHIGSLETVPVKLYMGDVHGKPAYDLRGVLTRGRLAFGGFPPGTYTLWIDTNPFAATIVQGVKLGPGDTDLGPLAVTKDQRLRLVFEPAPGDECESLTVNADYEGTPHHRRLFEVYGPTKSLVLQGLVPGRWSLTIIVRPRRSWSPFHTEVVVQRGETVTVTISLSAKSR